MSFYETTFIIRQDVSLADVDKITDDFTKIVQDTGGEIIKTEYWGLRSLAYDIGNNKKGHYVFFGIKAGLSDFLKNMKLEMKQKMKRSENILRHFNTKVDSISSEPSPILRSKNTENDGTIDVTVNTTLE